jgi:phosphoribosylformimino-5-aminoimidazole carboxamide ribotide isomerase
MILFPAIDLKEGKCVRLLRGDMATATVFNDSPAGQARSFEDAGCQWIHMVDLDGAFSGRPENATAVEAILSTVTIPIQLGGGIRTMETVEGWLEKGVRRVILGTAAVRDPDLVRNACAAFPGRIAVGIDAKDGQVAVSGWGDLSEVTDIDLAQRFEDAGVAAIIHTDIARDGAMAGPNVQRTVELARAISIPVILSGGVSSLEDVIAARDASAGLLEGVISGRAIYDGRLDIGEALHALNGKQG